MHGPPRRRPASRLGGGSLRWRCNRALPRGTTFPSSSILGRRYRSHHPPAEYLEMPHEPRGIIDLFSTSRSEIAESRNAGVPVQQPLAAVDEPLSYMSTKTLMTAVRGNSPPRPPAAPLSAPRPGKKASRDQSQDAPRRIEMLSDRAAGIWPSMTPNMGQEFLARHVAGGTFALLGQFPSTNHLRGDAR